MTTAGNAPGPVFVDGSGRRSRLVRRTCWGLGSLATVYVVAVLLALVVPAGLTRLHVPGLGAILPGPAAPGRPQSGGSAPLPSGGAQPEPSLSGAGRSPAAPLVVPGPPSPASTLAAATGPTSIAASQAPRPAAPTSAGASAAPRPPGTPRRSPGAPAPSKAPSGQPSSRPTAVAHPTPAAHPTPSPRGGRPAAPRATPPPVPTPTRTTPPR